MTDIKDDQAKQNLAKAYIEAAAYIDNVTNHKQVSDDWNMTVSRESWLLPDSPAMRLVIPLQTHHSCMGR